MKNKNKPKKRFLRNIFVFVVAVYAVFSMVEMQVTLANRMEEKEVLHEQWEMQRIVNKDLQRQLAADIDDEEIERVAREQLDFVSPDEKVFVDISGS